ncbi:unnamed protein product [Rotaria sordida]|uniref:Uncharacterized protein n=1 Tax=Rotaria sordida TaxID=392033 RepID=A0A815KPC0_9BILA|nr:unnamed protein product [Rotaria sordida]CAF1399040.1 unnamed protein product [Rotaria sordida]CAF1399062.1 unnamed protein product [Rotaria sordida]CAF3614297.1 unnamed protein product [Rotaria sordida]CAF3880755.1 unnamed protein product [Rotaria sordida]
MLIWSLVWLVYPIIAYRLSNTSTSNQNIYPYPVLLGFGGIIFLLIILCTTEPVIQRQPTRSDNDSTRSGVEPRRGRVEPTRSHAESRQGGVEPTSSAVEPRRRGVGLRRSDVEETAMDENRR